MTNNSSLKKDVDNDVIAHVQVWQRGPSLLNVLSAIANQTKKPKQVIITDDTPDWNPANISQSPIWMPLLKYMQYAGIAWVWEPGGGKGPQHNAKKVEDLKSKYIWKLTEYTIPAPNVLETLLSNMKDPKVGAVGGTLGVDVLVKSENPNPVNDPIFLHKNNAQFSLINQEKSFSDGIGFLDKTYLYRNNTTSQYFTLSKVGNLCDIGLTYNIKKAGYKLVIDPKALNIFIPIQHEMTENDNWLAIDDESKIASLLDPRPMSKRVEEWEEQNGGKLVILQNGLGDHFAFKKALPNIQKPGEKINLLCNFKWVFEDCKDLNFISREELPFTIDKQWFNIYGFMRHFAKKGTILKLSEALETFFKKNYGDYA
jgi:hypothetical protein